jgi:hypothetical protein
LSCCTPVGYHSTAIHQQDLYKRTLPRSRPVTDLRRDLHFLLQLTKLSTVAGIIPALFDDCKHFLENLMARKLQTPKDNIVKMGLFPALDCTRLLTSLAPLFP